MPATCVVGLQWGDEAKGKIVDLLADHHDYVVRYNGGANAGHTIVWGDRTFKLSLLPSGILKPRVRSVIGNGLVVYPPRFLEEIEQLQHAGIKVGDNLLLSEHAHLIFPYHIEEERLAETAIEGSIGTTGRGIGPCYQDKIGRRFGIRVGDLLTPSYLRERLRTIVPIKNRLLSAYANLPDANPPQFDPDQLTEEYLGYAERMRPFIGNATRVLHEGLNAGRSILFEAAQGSLLDVDHGTYPYVTSSSSLPGGIWPGTGIPTRSLTRIIGVVKAYTTRVGRGPFPTELRDATAERIRTIGREYGTVTGRPRRVGWFDAVAVRYTARLAAADEITIMLLDVLSGLPELKIATAYQHPEGSRSFEDFPSDAQRLEECHAIYETLPGWSEDLTRCRSWNNLPRAAQRYVERIRDLVGLPVTLISVGPDREQIIRLT